MPHLWIGADDALSCFWMWEHEGFCDKIGLHRASKGPVLVFPSNSFPDHCGIDTLVERLVEWATNHGFKPKVAA
jgi:hypothetical protein